MMKMKIALVVLAAMAIAAVASCPPGGNCDCGPNYDKLECPSWPYYDCTDLVCSCVAILGEPDVEMGTPGTPTVVTTCDAPACNAPQGNENSVSYSKTSGYSFSICIGGEVKFGVAVEWTISVEGCAEFSNETTITANADCSSPGCEWWKKSIVRTPTPVTVEIPVEYKTKVVYTNVSDPEECCNLYGYGPGGSWTVYFTCNTDTLDDSTTCYNWSFPLTNLTENCNYDPCGPCPL